jgi:hypothetical protein
MRISRVFTSGPHIPHWVLVTNPPKVTPYFKQYHSPLLPFKRPVVMLHKHDPTVVNFAPLSQSYKKKKNQQLANFYHRTGQTAVSLDGT